MKQNRKNKILALLNYLDTISYQSKPEQQAIKENIYFFNAITNIFLFIKWYFSRAVKLKQNQIMEFADFCDDHYNFELCTALAKLEKGFFPGLIKPLTKRIYNLSRQNTISTLLVLGCGAMEIERQLINKLIKKNNKKQYFIFGIDISEASRKSAIENLKALNNIVNIQEIDTIDDDILLKITQNAQATYNVILCKNDIFSLDKHIPHFKFDLTISSLFKHHLTDNQKSELDKIIINLSDRIIEYDGYKNTIILFIQAFYTWRHPLLLNGAVFSNLRYGAKKTLKHIEDNWRIKFYFQGTYLKEYYKKI